MIQPYFSIIMPAYNAEKYIEEAIYSVLNQHFADWELLVINDGSTDKTVEIVQRFINNEKKIKLISQENRRLGAARNTGLRNAIGNWITFLDADDQWLPEKLSVQYRFIQNKPEVDVFLSNGYTYYEEEKIKLYYHFPVAKGLIEGKEMYKTLFSTNLIPVLSVALKSEWIDKVGYQDEIVRGSEDWDYWLRLSLLGTQFFGIEQPLFIYRIHSGGMSAQNLTQRLSSTMIKMKNFRAELLDKQQIDDFKLEIASIYYQLTLENRHEEIVQLKEKAFTLVDKDGHHLVEELLFKHTLKNGNVKTKENFSFVQVIKNVVFFFLGNVVFPAFKKFDKHAHNLTIQYHRWLLGNNLKTIGHFYMHPSAKIIGSRTSGKIIAYGLTIFDNSQINISSPKGLMISAKDVTINKFCHFNIWGKLSIGNNVLFNNYCSLNCLDDITIGDNTWFGEGVRFYDHNHQFKDRLQSFTNQGFTTGKISIGSNVWVGSNTIILQNVAIGDNCVIGANNLIYKSVPANTIVKARAMEMIENIKS